MQSHSDQSSGIEINDPVLEAEIYGLASELGVEPEEAIAQAVRFRLNKLGIDASGRATQNQDQDK
jgi:hypothetical protein